MASSASSVALQNCASLAVQSALQQILALPPPQQNEQQQQQQQQRREEGETAVEMDFWTAASLNTENIRDFNFEEELNAKNAAGWTPLMYAAYLGHRELCQLFVLRGADVEAVNERDQTGIMLASSCGAIDVVRILLDFSADCNRRDQYGRSSLHYAVKYYHAPVVQLLLENGADPNLPDFNDSTPVLAACENGDEKILAYLLEQKGDPTRCNKQGQNAFTINADDKLQSVLKKYRKKDSELEKLLCQLELQKYSPNFAKGGVWTIEALLKVTERELDEMGIHLVGPKRKITNFIRERTNHQQQQQQQTSSQQIRLHPPPTIGVVQQQPEQQQQQQQQQQQLQMQQQQQNRQQQRMDELGKLCADQRREMQEQRRVNAQCRLLRKKTKQKILTKCQNSSGADPNGAQRTVHRVRHADPAARHH
uniref:NAD(+) ADP-ribosyltransferase n=1 Tax=Globodera rostochiensis TaxID=31243 RepID=A0A914I9F3_GLORO